MEHEHTIVMLKPDCLHKKLEKAILSEILAHRFVIRHSKRLTLTDADIDQCFLHTDKRYRSYLTSGPVEIWLLSGEDALRRMSELKYEIRKSYRVLNQIENLIHAVDEGTEYYLFLRHFFPELDPVPYSTNADHDLVLRSGSAAEKRRTMEELARKSRLKQCIVRLRNESDLQLAESLRIAPIRGLDVRFKINVFLSRSRNEVLDVELLPDEAERWYRLAAESEPEQVLENAARAGLTVSVQAIDVYEDEKTQYRAWISRKDPRLDELLMETELLRYVAMLKAKYQVRGLMCFRPNHSLLLTELLMDVCRLLDLQTRGGSGEEAEPGHFSVPLIV